MSFKLNFEGRTVSKLKGQLWGVVTQDTLAASIRNFDTRCEKVQFFEKAPWPMSQPFPRQFCSRLPAFCGNRLHPLDERQEKYSKTTLHEKLSKREQERMILIMMVI